MAARAIEPAATVSALARSLERSRPSVSRSLHRLAAKGYIEQQGRSWHLTETGQQEAEKATKALQAGAKEFVEIAGKKFKAVSRIHDTISGLSAHLAIGESMAGLAFDPANTTLGQMTSLLDQFSLANALGPGSIHDSVAAMSGISHQAEQLLGPATLAAPIDSAHELSDMASGVINPALSASSVLAALNPDWEDINPIDEAVQLWQLEGATALVSPLLNAQDAYASILDTLPALDNSLGYGAIAEQTRLLSSTLANVMEVPDYAHLTASLALDRDLLALPGNLALISASLADVFQENLALVGVPEVAVPSQMVASRLYHSTLPVASYARGTRVLLEDGISDDEREIVDPPQKLGLEELDPLLAKIDPDLVGKRRGAWMALDGTNPHRLAHAAGSQKNLLLQVLRTLVPDEPDVDPTERGSKIKARIKQIMGGSESEAEHFQAVAEAVFTAYNVYNKYDHTNQKNARALRGHIHSGEALLYMVLIRLED